MIVTAFLLPSLSGEELGGEVNAQQYLNQPNLQNRPAEKKVTFWDVQKAFNEYWKDKECGKTEGENAEEGGYEQFKRWEAFMKQRTFPSGNFPSPEILFNEHLKFKNADGYKQGMNTAAANWSFIGPGVIPGNGGGSGRLNCIAFDPNNSNIIWIGAACGGLWKSTDGGVTWSTNTDLLPSLSISDIAIDPTNPQTMYIATGDKYGIYFQYEVWGHYSAGVLKSTDGGATWNPTGMNYVLSNGALIQRMILDANNTTVLFAATNQGIFQTTNGGTSWSNIKSGSYYDIEFHPTNHDTIYAGDNAGVIRSFNGGVTWNTVSGVTSTERTSIAVTPATPNAVYVWSSGGGLYYSGNSGNSFVTRTDPSSSCTPYGYYDMVLEVSPTNQNVLVAGGLEIALTTNGGSTWQNVSDWSSWPATNYVHADHHALSFAPGSSTTIFACNDGGIFKSTDQASTWSDLSNGIDIKQYYRMASSFLTPSLMYAGAQDNGTDKINGLSATMVNGADGEDCLIDFTDDNIVFVSSQGGWFLKSTDGGVTFNSITGSGCDWTSPIIMDANNHDVMYIGSASVEKSTDNGVSWNTLAGPFDGTCMYSLEISPSNSNYVYAATFGNIYRTTNGGTSWTNITGTLPVSNAAISGIAINGSNPDAVWVTFSGFSAADKIYYTSDGGSTWANVSGTLPNIPINCIEYQNGSNDIVYIGTDLGVFYTDATLNNWISYNTGLPNVIIDELEVYTPTSKLRAATFGRGIWESDLQVSTLLNVDASAVTMVYPPQSTCDTVIAPIVRIRNAGINTLTSVDLKYKTDAQPIQTYNWAGSLVSFATADITLPSYTFTSGTHTLTAYTTNPNISTDQNNLNDTIVRTFTILANPTAMQAPVMEGFVSTTFPPTNWTLENSSGLWSRSATVGGYSLSTQSARADFFSISSGTDKIISSYIDFQNLVAPIRLYFDVAYAPYSASYIDSLAVDLYDDCDGTAQRIYTKESNTLATAPPTTSYFIPTSTQWRTDTINLDTMAGKPSMLVRFLAISGYGNYLYIDNINLTGNPVGIAQLSTLTSQLSIYPNPTSGKANVTISQFENLKMKDIEIYNVVGEKVAPSNSPKGGAINSLPSGGQGWALDLSSQPSGVYFITIKTEQGTANKKLIIQK